MATSSKIAVLAAVAGNTTLTLAKFAVFFVTGSGAMFSEAIHSLADTGNQALLYLGIRKSERPADALFHYGYGGERFLYALLSAIGIFVLGCGFTVYHAIHDLLDPPRIVFSWWSVAVLSVAFVVEGSVLLLALRAIRARLAPGERLWAHLRTTRDPTVAAVLLEDSVACLGVVVAGAAMGLSVWTNDPVYDALGALLIGGMLGGVAVFLGVRNRELLLGPALDEATRRQVVVLIEADPAVASVRSTRSRVLGSDRFRIYADVVYDGAELGRRALARIEAEGRRLDCASEAGRRAAAEALGRAVVDAMAEANDRLEDALRARFPGLVALESEAEVRSLESGGAGR